MSEAQKGSGEKKGGTKITGRVEDIKGGRERSESFGTLPELWQKKRKADEGAEGGEGQECKRIVKEVEEGTGKVEKLIEKMTDKIMEGIAKEMNDMKKELVDMRKEMNKKQEEWRSEKERMTTRIGEMEKKMEKKEGEGISDKRWKDMEERMEKMENRYEGKGNENSSGGREWESRIKEIERSIQIKDREKRKRNVIVKGLKVGVGDARKEVEKIMEELGAEVKIREVKRIRAGREEWGEMMCVELASTDEKGRVMEKKSKLKGSNIWIDEDLTWEERKRRECIRRVVKEEREKGNKVIIGKYGIKINGEWWEWDKEKKVVRKEVRRGRGEGGGQKVKERRRVGIEGQGEGEGEEE